MDEEKELPVDALIQSRENQYDYYIKIGSVCLLSEFQGERNPQDDREKLLKEMRIRVGVLLKTDNVSFLFGAGASIAAGGVSLSTIPKLLERELLEQAKHDKVRNNWPRWIELFYDTVSFILQNPLGVEARLSLCDSSPKAIELPVIAINLEEYLNQLYTWKSAIGEENNSMTVRAIGRQQLTLRRVDLEKLIKTIMVALSKLLDLPIPSKGKESLNAHRRLIKKVLTRPLNLRRVNLFTLNYDTLLEQAADSAGAVLVDGFVGTLKRIFRPESYDLDYYFPAQTTEGRVHRFDRALHLYKLHGSLNWHRSQQSWQNPYGLYASFYNQQTEAEDVLIYPSPLKYGQTLALPYSELFRRFGNTIAQPQSVLFIIGYGFGDEHVNALIRQALAIPSFTLVVVDPSPASDFVQALESTDDERVWIIKGWQIGTFDKFVEKLLPDLRDEEITEKVMQTLRLLQRKSGEDDFDDVK
ncbi:MAG: SIR2 family protein [Smithella sp.]